MSKFVKIKDDIDLKVLCSNWDDDGSRYSLEGPFEEFCLISKDTRIVTQTGYNHMVYSWLEVNVAEMID